MKTVLVTGSEGFIGKNLCVNLRLNKNLRVISFNKTDNQLSLEKRVRESDFIFHIAGVNRPEDNKMFEVVNAGLTSRILKAIDKSKRQIPILLTSSIQSQEDNPYGKSKKHAEDLLVQWSKHTNNEIYIFRLPNVFGKWSKPNYNSVVATFCHNIANELEIKINDPDKIITFVYIDDVVKAFLSVLHGSHKHKKTFCEVEKTFQLSLGQLAQKLNNYHDMRRTLQIPDFSNLLDRYLYATFTSFYSNNKLSYRIDKMADERGWLAEFIKADHFGQVFVSLTKPGFTRGNHWHNTKVEKFFVVSGEGLIQIRNHGTNQVTEYKTSSSTLTIVDMPAGSVHSITNTGKADMITLFWSSEVLNKVTPDTNYEEVRI